LAKIHPTALVSPKAELAADVTVGAYTVIDEGVKIGAGTTIGTHCLITGLTTIGANNTIWHAAAIGTAPQDLKYRKKKSFLSIGDGNTFREYTTANPGTHEGSTTFIGNDNFFMASSHIAHDCVVGNNVIMANSVPLAGHARVEDGAVLGGLSAVHQFVRVGRLAMIGGLSKVTQDILPFSIADGNPVKTKSVNVIGLRRGGFSEETIRIVREGFRRLFFSKDLWEVALKKLSDTYGDSPEIMEIYRFAIATKRGIAGR